MGFCLCKSKANPVTESGKRKGEPGRQHLISYESAVYTPAVRRTNYHIKGQRREGITKIHQSDITGFIFPWPLHGNGRTLLNCETCIQQTHSIVQYYVTASVLNLIPLTATRMQLAEWTVRVHRSEEFYIVCDKRQCDLNCFTLIETFYSVIYHWIWWFNTICIPFLAIYFIIKDTFIFPL
jgi:hypothetical protein